MASPQKENGYTPIANEIFDQLMKVKLNGTQFRIIMAVWRYTYGFSRKEYPISQIFISKITGIARPHICREIQLLFDMRILSVVKESTFKTSAVIAFNKNYDNWVTGEIPATGTKNAPGTETVNVTGTELGTLKDKQYLKQDKGSLLSELPPADSDETDTLLMTDDQNAPGTMLDEKGLGRGQANLEDSRLEPNKTIVTKKIRHKQIYKHDSLYYKASKWLADHIESRISGYQKHTEATIQTWADSARLMFESDKRNVDLVRELLVFSQSDDFWKNNILSIPKFREQFDQLNIRYNEKRNRSVNISPTNDIGHFENYRNLGG